MERIAQRYVRLTYFAENGEYYCEGSYSTMYTRDAQIYLEVRAKRKLGFLPDLDSGFWDGFILVNPENGSPHIIEKDEVV